MRRILNIAAALMLIQVGTASNKCRFAPSYTSDQLINSEVSRVDFFRNVINAELKFIREVGVNKETGLTIGSVPISSRTGIVKSSNNESMKSTLKNEAIHIAVLAKSLLNESQIYSQDQSLGILKLKMQTIALFSGR